MRDIIKKHPKRLAIFTLFVCALVLLCIFLPHSTEPLSQQNIIDAINAEETYPNVPGDLETTYQSIDDVITAADVIVTTSITEQSIEYPDGYPQTHTKVNVTKVHKGDVKVGGHLSVIEEGGYDGMVLGLPMMRSDYTYTLLLDEYDGNYYVCGALYGRFVHREGHLFQQSTVETKLDDYQPLTPELFESKIAEVLE